MTKFKEVAHLYLGCALSDPAIQYTYRLRPGHLNVNGDVADFLADGTKPAFFPLSAMTEEQSFILIRLHWFYGRYDIRDIEVVRNVIDFKVCYGKIKRWYRKRMSIRGETPEQFAYLLSQRFDLFNLIPEQEAIDVTTLEINPYEK